MVAGMLWELGCWIGRTKYADEYNPRGYFENTPIRHMMKAIYGFDLLGCFPSTQIGWRSSVKREITSQGYRGGPWLLKTGAHYSGLWDEFAPVVVKVMRDRDRIIESYKRYGGIWHSYGREGVEKVVDRGLARLWNMPGIEVDSDVLVGGDTSAIQKVCKRAFLPYRQTDFIIPGAFHAR